MQVRKIKIAYRTPFVFTVAFLINRSKNFCSPCLTRSLQRSLWALLPSLQGREVPFRKAFWSFRHSKVTPGRLLLTLDTARLHSMTQSHSVALSFLKLWKRLSFSCPAAISNTCKGTTWSAKCFFSHCLLLLTSQMVEPKNVSKTEMKADDFRAGVKFQAESPSWARLLLSRESQLPCSPKAEQLSSVPPSFQLRCFTLAAFSQSSAQISQARLSRSEFTY